MKMCISSPATEQKAPGTDQIHRSLQNFGSSLWKLPASHPSGAQNLVVFSILLGNLRTSDVV
jgi:hypothetical protein